MRTKTQLPIGKKTNLPTATESNILFVASRAREKAAAAELREIELAATKRAVVRQEEVKIIFGQIGTIIRGRLLKMRSDLVLCSGRLRCSGYR
jgi:hypothetical protein